MNYYFLNRDEILKRRSVYYLENKAMINERSKTYFKSYYQENKENILKQCKEKRYNENPIKTKRCRMIRGESKIKKNNDDKLNNKVETHYILDKNDFVIDLKE